MFFTMSRIITQKLLYIYIMLLYLLVSDFDVKIRLHPDYQGLFNKLLWLEIFTITIVQKKNQQNLLYCCLHVSVYVCDRLKTWIFLYGCVFAKFMDITGKIVIKIDLGIIWTVS